MFRSVIPAALMLAAALTGCGGGGGGSADPSAQTAAAAVVKTFNLGATALQTIFVPSLVQAKLDATDAQYVIMSGWHVGSLAAPPVKIYRVPSSGDPVDATVAILGSEFSWSVEHALVADFNGDGIDDIFFGGFTDAPGTSNNASTAFMSRAGQSHLQVTVSGLSWSHGIIAVDFDRDGDLDVLNASGRAWINDGQGNFTFVSYNDFPGGSGVCSGDFENNGHVQIVLTDSYDGLIDNYIVEYNTVTQTWTKRYTLPTPVLDRYNTSLIDEYSHDVSCVVGDLDSDGKKDIVIISANNSPQVLAGTQPHGTQVQIYRNLGNMTFEDATATDGIPYQTIHSSYTPRLIDFNGDGRLDLWLMNADWQGVSANQVWLNQGNLAFKQARVADINALSTTAIMLPLLQNGRWNIVYANTSYTDVTVKLIATQWSIQ